MLTTCTSLESTTKPNPGGEVVIGDARLLVSAYSSVSLRRLEIHPTSVGSSRVACRQQAVPRRAVESVKRGRAREPGYHGGHSHAVRRCVKNRRSIGLRARAT